MKKEYITGVTIIAGILITGALGIGLQLPTHHNPHTNRHEMNVSLQEKVESLDSNLYASLSASSLISATDVGLYTTNANGKPVNAIAAGQPTISANKLIYTYRLHHYRWSDGETVTADDFVYAWQRLVDPKYNSRNASRADFLKNAVAIRNGKKPVTALGVQALGKYRLRITLSKPNSQLADTLSQTPFAPIKRNFAERLGAKYGTSSKYVLANGPYIVTNWKGPRDTRWTLKRNSAFTPQDFKPLKQINFRVLNHDKALTAYNNRKLDFVTLTATETKKYRSQADFKSIRTTAAGFLFLNMTSGVTQNANLRKALATGFNKHLLTQGELLDGSMPLNGIIPSGLGVSSAQANYRQVAGQMAPYDLNKSIAYWHKAQQELGRHRITVRLNIADNALADTTADFIKYQLQHNLPGLTIRIKKTGFKKRIKVDQSGNFDMIFATWTPASEDPASLLKLNANNNVQSGPRYNSSKYNHLVNRIIADNDLGSPRRLHMIMNAEKLLTVKDTAVIGVMQLGFPYLVNKTFADLSIMDNGAVNYAALHE